MASLWIRFVDTVIVMAWGWGVIRVLNPLVTHVRARHGLAMAWGTAILGFAVLFAGIGVIAWVEIVMLS